MSERTVLVTGATGFVGRALVSVLSSRGHVVRSAVRRCGSGAPNEVAVGDLQAPNRDSLKDALAGSDAVVHLAARVHVMSDSEDDPLAVYRAVNVVATESVARMAAEVGVERFVFLSSIKVNGEGTPGGTAFTERDKPAPQDAYAVSKHEAERALHQVAQETGLQVVIVRPPLVYGPGVRANFLRLMNMVARCLPLPLGAVDNRRSLVGLTNLVDFLVTCLDHPMAVGETFLVSDGEDLSTPELIGRIAGAMGRPARLFPFPPGWLQAGGRLLGLEATVERLCGSLQVDIGKARGVLGWQPVSSVDEELARTADWYIQSRSDRRGR
ncbi:UDP-glucose 4-epimerase [Desulfacinum hydrothermale DSM 13146]|uniref:UDP-glucose 4-epimerase n=1 Tax=Desulfacinum hydrothermale DSM 13146 TaxID=1121390 RepID=A0A1W1XRB1_9BACT|nr:SDR family oxidoreductase [Desulfacinum hydrothermale]SMC26503.1 UDP-glucose 4-epimerase [Desulfacinum hydrothermale DSM 13146]